MDFKMDNKNEMLKNKIGKCIWHIFLVARKPQKSIQVADDVNIGGASTKYTVSPIYYKYTTNTNVKYKKGTLIHLVCFLYIASLLKV